MDKHLGFWLGSLLCIALHADQPASQAQQAPVSHQVIEKQLSEAEKEFKIAKEMFNPWYAGPLLAPSAHILPPGMVNIQPYLFFTNNYAQYSESGRSHGIPRLHQINAQFVALIGVLSWMDISVVGQGFRNTKKGHTSVNWGDTSLALNFGLLPEGPYNPALLIGVQETFPTGPYQHLNPRKQGTNAIGEGSYQTKVSFNISKVIWWIATHPIATRLSLGYNIPAPVTVKSFNTFGGGRGTHGKVKPGNTFSGDLGLEYSFTQRWVLACDFVYTYSQKTKFSGHTKAPVGGPFNDQLSLAPALEYNPTPDLGFLAGVWFTVWGRNSFAFVSTVLTVTYTF